MKLFPIMAEYGDRIKQHTVDYIPIEVIKHHEAQALKNHGQTLERLACRGGLSYCEALAVLEDRDWTRIDQREAKIKVFTIVGAFEMLPCMNVISKLKGEIK